MFARVLEIEALQHNYINILRQYSILPLPPSLSPYLYISCVFVTSNISIKLFKMD